MDSPVVTVILFVHAPYARFLPQSLASILTQSYSSLEVIVLSDGSAEVSEAVEPFKEDGRWVVYSQGELPVQLAANQLMTNCRGKYIGTWNSDDIYNKDHVRVLVKALERDPELGGAFDNTEFFQESKGDLHRKSGDISLGFIVPQDRAKKLALSRLSVQYIFNENIMTGPSSVIRKTAFERVGGYDTKIRLNSDLHWFYRIGAYFPVRFVDYVGVRKRIHPLNNTAVNPHYEFGVRELQDIRDNYPDVYARIGKNVFDKKLGRKYFRLGFYYEKQGATGEAREMYRKAMELRRFSFRYHWEYFRCTLASLKSPDK